MLLMMMTTTTTTTIEWDQLPCLIRFLARCRWEPLLTPTLKEKRVRVSAEGGKRHEQKTKSEGSGRRVSTVQPSLLDADGGLERL